MFPRKCRRIRKIPSNIETHIKRVLISSSHFAQLDTKRIGENNETQISKEMQNDVEKRYVENNTLRLFQIVNAIHKWIHSCDAEYYVNNNYIQVMEVGLGYGEVAQCVATIYPEWRLFALEHPTRTYMKLPEYLSAMEKSEVRIIAADLTERNLPLATESFHLCLLCEVIEHLSPTVAANLIDELARVTKPGGGIIIASPNLMSLLNRIAFALGKSVFAPATALDYAGATYGHIRLYSPHEISYLASRSGLHVVDTLFSNSHLFSGGENLPALIIKVMQSLLSSLLPALANNWTTLYCKSRKHT